jgi:hypothetical protein
MIFLRKQVIASASEISKFSFNNGQISSQQFSRSSKIWYNTMNINFNPSSKTINTQKDDKKRSFAWNGGT